MLWYAPCNAQERVKKRLNPNSKHIPNQIRVNNWTVLTWVDKRLNRWAEHFGELLNRPIPQHQPDIQLAEEDLLIDRNKPTREEIKWAIGQFQNRKAAGPDGIPAESLKGDVTTSAEMLYSL